MVRHTSGKHLLMNAFLNDIPVKVVVDTAAMITLVNEKLICGEEHGDEGLVMLRGLGEQLVYGRIVKNVHIKIGSQTITWDVCTAPLRDDLILGLDFLEAHKAVIRLGAETVKINGELIQAKLVANQTTESSVARILLHETIKIPPNSMMTVAVPLKEPLRGNFIMEPVPITKVLIASSLCTGNIYPVNLVNDSNQYVKLRKDTILGQTEAVSGLVEGSTEVLGHNASQNTLWSPDIQIKQSKLNTETENEPSDIIPPHLRDMYDRAIKGLNPEERKKLKSLLIEYQDVFAKHDLDLGCLTAVKPVFNLDCLIWMSGDHRVFCEALCPSTSVEHSIRPETASVCPSTVSFLSFTYWLLSFTRLTGQTFPVHKLLAMRTLVIGTGSIMKLPLNGSLSGTATVIMEFGGILIVLCSNIRATLFSVVWLATNLAWFSQFSGC
jgi:hypothetical protein